MGAENQVFEVTSCEEHQENVTFSIGQLLRQARQEKGLSLVEVATETRIRQLFIQAIEAGNFDSLPGEIYKIGFIKTYASFLELDAEEILRRLGLHQVESVMYINNRYIIPTEAQRHPNKKILYLSLLGALGFSIFAYVTYNSYEKEDVSHLLTPFLEPSQPIIDNLVKDEPAFSGAKGEESKESSLSVLPIEREEQNISSPVEESPDVRVTVSSAETSKPLDNSLPSKKVIVKAVKDTWVQILDSSEKIVYVRLMHAGDTYSLPSEGIYKLNTGNAGGIKIMCNEKETNTLGTEGQVIRGILLTPEGLSSYFLS